MANGNNCWDPSELVEWTGGYLDDYRNANMTHTRTKSPEIQTKWQPPPDGTVSVCVDAAVNRKDGKYGIGCILRDYKGFVIASGISARSHVMEPSQAEVMALGSVK